MLTGPAPTDDAAVRFLVRAEKRSPKSVAVLRKGSALYSRSWGTGDLTRWASVAKAPAQDGERETVVQ